MVHQFFSQNEFHFETWYEIISPVQKWLKHSSFSAKRRRYQFALLWLLKLKTFRHQVSLLRANKRHKNTLINELGEQCAVSELVKTIRNHYKPKIHSNENFVKFSWLQYIYTQISKCFFFFFFAVEFSASFGDDPVFRLGSIKSDISRLG